MSVRLVPQEGHWYQDVDGASEFVVLSYDDHYRTALVKYSSGCVEEIDEDCWQEMNLRSSTYEEEWGSAHTHAFDITDSYDKIYNTDTLQLTIETDNQLDT